MLQPYHGQTIYIPPAPSLVGLDFKLISAADPTNIHYLNIVSQIDNWFGGASLTGTWTGNSQSDVHQVTGTFSTGFPFIVWLGFPNLVCSWSSKAGTPPDRFIKDGILTYSDTLSKWKLDGTVTDGNGNSAGPGKVSGWTV